MYRDALTRVWVLDEVPAWIPANNPLRELGQSPKHQLADPALAAQLLGTSPQALLSGRGSLLTRPDGAQDRTLLGALFESLVAQSVRVYAVAAEARVGHFRTARGRQEIDLIVERADGGVVAIEVKLTKAVASDAGQHLRWLAAKLGDRVLDQLIITTGPSAYRRQDGIAVIPAALLGP
jgi:predicted AAA+ superfamily ATPase